MSGVCGSPALQQQMEEQREQRDQQRGFKGVHVGG
jgi:hypothetical protein